MVVVEVEGFLDLPRCVGFEFRIAGDGGLVGKPDFTAARNGDGDGDVGEIRQNRSPDVRPQTLDTSRRKNSLAGELGIRCSVTVEASARITTVFVFRVDVDLVNLARVFNAELPKPQQICS